MNDCRCAYCGCCRFDHQGWKHPFEEKPEMGKKQYNTLEKVAIGTVLVLVGASLASALLGVIALADLVF